MFRWVFISENVPRDLKTLNANLSEGLQGLNFFGYFFLIGGIFFLVIAIMKIRMLFPYIGIFAVIIVGYSMLSKSKKDVGAKADLFYKRNWNRREGGQTRKGNESFFQYFEIYHHSKDWR